MGSSSRCQALPGAAAAVRAGRRPRPRGTECPHPAQPPRRPRADRGRCRSAGPRGGAARQDGGWGARLPRGEGLRQQHQLPKAAQRRLAPPFLLLSSGLLRLGTLLGLTALPPASPTFSTKYFSHFILARHSSLKNSKLLFPGEKPRSRAAGAAPRSSLSASAPSSSSGKRCRASPPH